MNLPYGDIIGQKRIRDGDNNGSVIIDMGTYEFAAIPVGIEKQIVRSSVFDVRCFPNPAKNEVFISVKDGQIIKAVNIYTQIGQRVICKKGKTNSVDVSMLPHGMYIIEVEIDNGKVRSKLMIE